MQEYQLLVPPFAMLVLVLEMMALLVVLLLGFSGVELWISVVETKYKSCLSVIDVDQNKSAGVDVATKHIMCDQLLIAVGMRWSTRRCHAAIIPLPTRDVAQTDLMLWSCPVIRPRHDDHRIAPGVRSESRTEAVSKAQVLGDCLASRVRLGSVCRIH